MDIVALSKQIAANDKALLEATELRQKEKGENEDTIESTETGKEGVEFALKTLKDFYGSFLQKSKYVPPNSDSSGNTVGDLAPEVFDSDYEGQKSSSGGIVGMLEVILSDF